jgi:hypothetical protein
VIQSNFNGTAIVPGSTIWFNSVLKVSGLTSSPVTLHVVNGEIDFSANGTPYHVAVPDAFITFSPAGTSGTTTFDVPGRTWRTAVPSNVSGNTFLTGVGLAVPSGLPGGINPVTWQADFQTDTAGVTVNWQWATAVYTSFSTDNNALNVKPVDRDQLSAYHNSDHAGTPEAYRSFVVGGARGGGGSNFTGSYSATGHVTPEVVTQPAPASLSGFVFADNNGILVGLSGATLTLTGTNDLGQAVTLTTTSNATGQYSFTGLRPGTYAVRETPPPNYAIESTNVGTVNGAPDGTADFGVISSITLHAGDSGINYDFTDILPGGGGGS